MSTEARLRYRNSMSASAHFDPVSLPPQPLDRRRTRQSFMMNNKRVDPSSFIRQGGSFSKEASSARQAAHKTNFEGGLALPTEDASFRPRRVSLIDPPRAPAGQEEYTFKSGRKMIAQSGPSLDAAALGGGEEGGTDQIANTSFNSGSLNNNSLSMRSLMSPTAGSKKSGSVRTELSTASSPPVHTHIKCNVKARVANNMDSVNITPARKGSRWNRKKSIEAGKAEFLKLCSPKRYGFAAPTREPSTTATGNGSGVAPANKHVKMFEKVACARQAVSPPWATNY